MQIEKPAPPVLSRRGGYQLYFFVLCKVLFRQADSFQTAITNFRKFLCAGLIVDGNIRIYWADTQVAFSKSFTANFFDIAFQCDIIIYI